MEIFKIWAIVGFLFLFLELIFPALFFLNLAVGAFFAAIFAFFFIENTTAQTIIFAVISTLSVLLVRPFILNKRTKNQKTGVEGKYIGEKAQVIKKIGEENTDGIGKIKIYGEVWDAKSENEGDVFETFEMVEIVRNESLVMFVRKQEEK